MRLEENKYFMSNLISNRILQSMQANFQTTLYELQKILRSQTIV